MPNNIYDLGAALRPSQSNQRHILRTLKDAARKAILQDRENYAASANDHAVLAAQFTLEEGGSFDEAVSHGLKVRESLQAIHDRRVTAVLDLISTRAQDAGLPLSPDNAYHQALVRARRAADAGLSIGEVMIAALGPNLHLANHPERRK